MASIKRLFWLLVLALPAFGQVAPQITGSGAPSNPCSQPGQYYVDTATGNYYVCSGVGANWALKGKGSANTSSGYSSGGSTVNVVPKADGTGQLADSLLTDNGTTLSYTGTGGISLPTVAATGSNGGILLTDGTGASAGTPAAGNQIIYAGTTTGGLVINSENKGAATLATCAANTFCFGGQDAATSTAYTLKGQDVAAGTGGNVAGANITFQAPNGVGSGGGGSFIFQTGVAHGSDTVKDTQTTALTINAAQQLITGIAGTVSVPAIGFNNTTIGWATPVAGAASWVQASNAYDTINGPSVAGQINIASGGLFSWSSGASANTAADTGFSRLKAAWIGFGNGSANDTSAAISADGNKTVLTADWTCGTGGTVSSCTSPVIIGSGGGVPMTFTLPLLAKSYQLDCDFIVGQATGATANNWNLLTATNGATNTMAFFDMYTAAGTKASGATTGQGATTASFNIGGTWTLGGTGTKMPVHIHAAIEGASASGTVLSVQLVAPTVGDLVTIYRGGSCTIH